MTELELAWQKFNSELEACHKYAEVAVMNSELCLDACRDACHYSEQALDCISEVEKDLYCQ